MIEPPETLPYPEGGIIVSKKGETIFLIVAAAAVGVGAMVATYLRTPFDDLFEESGKRHGVDPNLLRAIARHESSMQADAISRANSNGTRDYGLMQINERNFGFLGLTRETSLRARDSIDAAARFLVQLRKELGNKLTPQTLVAAYNAGSPAIKERGIFNHEYVASVQTHHELYSLGKMFA